MKWKGRPTPLPTKVLAVALPALLLLTGVQGIWEVWFITTEDGTVDYWKYSDSYELIDQGGSGVVSDMILWESRGFKTRVRHGSLSVDYEVEHHFAWDSMLDFQSSYKDCLAGVTFISESGGEGYHNYDTLWRYEHETEQDYYWSESGATLQAISRTEAHVSYHHHIREAGGSWTQIDNVHRYFDIV